MATTQTQPSFTNIDLLPPVLYEKGKDPEKYLLKLNQHLLHISQWSQEIDNQIRNSFFISEARIIELTAEKITAGSIFTQDLYIGEEQNIRLLGSTDNIDIYDNQGTEELRVRLGKQGAGNSNYGIRAWDSSGNLVFEVADAVLLDGVIIQDGSIDASAKITAGTVTATEMNVTQLSAISANLGTITAGSISATASVNGGAIDTGTLNANLVNVINLSASNITTGTLVADGNPAIQITGSGAFLLSNGGDILCRSSATDYSVIRFQSSAAASVGEIRITGSASSPTGIGITGANGKIITFSTSSADISFNASAGLVRFNTPIVGFGSGNIQTATGIQPNINNVYNCGTSTRKWANVWTVVNNVGDIIFENKYRLTEMDKVSDKKGTEGMALLNHRGTVILKIDKYGNLYPKGKIKDFNDL